MGLDMYLSGSKFIGHNPPTEERELVEAVREGLNLPDCESALSSVETSIMQWRKANHIHKWFVDNCQAGVDNCERYEVKLADLEKLHGVLGQLMGHDEKLAAQLLPPCEGCFFGNTELDEYYWDDIDRTHAVLGEWIDFIKKDEERRINHRQRSLERYPPMSWGWELFYRASW